MSTPLDTLELEIRDNAEESCAGLEKLRGTLERLQTVTSNLGISRLAKEVNSLSEASKGVQSDKLNQLANALKSLASVGKIKLSGTLSKQLASLGEVTKALSLTDFSGIDRLTFSLKPLGELGKAQLNSFIKQLSKLPEVAKSLASADIDKFTNTIQRLTLAMKPLAVEMEKVSRGFSAMPSKIQKLIQSGERLASTNSKTGRSFGVLGTGISSQTARLTMQFMVVRQVADTIGEWVRSSNEYVENMNLFTVSMGKYAGEALSYAEKVNQAMGIDMSQWIRNQGIFMQIATGFGVIEEKAYAMSRGLTQIGYDISSFYNIDITEAMLKVQSGISGESEPLRRLGYALDVATLQQIAYDNGIRQSINTMTQAQKSQLRYIAIMQQSKNVMGDMSRTLVSPANAMRILNQQIDQLNRALGNLFIPLLMKILPYVQAFVELMTELANAIAGFLGFTIPTIDYSGMDGLTSGAEDVGGAMDDATEAAKKLKNVTTGFDELNILGSEDDGKSGANGGAGVGGGSDLGLDLDAYKFFDEEQLKDFRENVEKIKDDLKEVLKVVGLIAAGLLAWKIAKGFMDFLGSISSLQKIKDLLDKITAWSKANGTTFSSILGKETFVPAAGVLAGIIGTLAIMALRFVDLYNKSEDFRTGIGAIGDFFKSVWSWITETAIPAIGDFFEAVIPPEVKDKLKEWFAPLGEMADDLDLDLTDLLIIVGGIIGLFIPVTAPFAAALLIFEAFTIGVRQIGDALNDTNGQIKPLDAALEASTNAITIMGSSIGTALGPVGMIFGGLATGAMVFGSIMGQDVVREIAIFDDTISETTKAKVAPFLDKMRELDDVMATLEMTKPIISDEIAADVKAKVEAISNTIINELDADKNANLEMLNPLKNTAGMTDETFAEIIEGNNRFYETMKAKVEAGEKRINEIMEKASKEKRALTTEEQIEINSIQEEMTNTGVKCLSDSEIETLTILNNMKENAARVSLEQASEVIKNAQNAKKESVKAAQEQYTKITENAKQMLEVGSINKETYDAIVAAALDAKENAIDDATEQYTEIESITREKLGETAKYLDFTNGEIKSNWKAFTEDLSSKWNTFTTELPSKIKEGLTNLEAKWNSFKTGFKTGWDGFWTGIDNAFKGAWDSVVLYGKTKLNSIIGFINTLIDGVNSLTGKLPGIGDNIQIPHIPELDLNVVPKYAKGGFVDEGQLFIARERGAEMVGSMGGRTAVANNEQIVEGIEDGVYRAVTAAMAGKNDSGTQTEIRVYLDGKQITATVEKHQRERGARIMPGGVVVNA